MSETETPPPTGFVRGPGQAAPLRRGAVRVQDSAGRGLSGFTTHRFSLLEVLVAMMILALVAIPVLSGFHLAMRNLEMGRRYHTAVIIAQSRLCREVSTIMNGRESGAAPPLPSGFDCNVTESQNQGFIAVQVTVSFELFGEKRDFQLNSAVFVGD
ncbi:MAG: hypothetical protein A3K19_07050 [Lentisphaerae bacterium RIFOXYB12_FULL_65_16]|nr:MAG: hypothetical protein A3K18_12275 [Lentisphaerae bacterium RIFOXYA12_64_32]OGV93279.1 MAG: hypothetical protein A3K19_07050 [Lentisphaerae bacterium RIFOXYB12_FULL_65_16]